MWILLTFIQGSGILHCVTCIYVSCTILFAFVALVLLLKYLGRLALFFWWLSDLLPYTPHFLPLPCAVTVSRQCSLNSLSFPPMCSFILQFDVIATLRVSLGSIKYAYASTNNSLTHWSASLFYRMPSLPPFLPLFILLSFIIRPPDIALYSFTWILHLLSSVIWS